MMLADYGAVEAQRVGKAQGSVQPWRRVVTVGGALGLLMFMVAGVVAPKRSVSSLTTEALSSEGVATVPALGGVDVVAYFSLEAGAEPVFGVSKFRHVLRTRDSGAESEGDSDGGGYFWTTFYFSSARNRDRFAADPAMYAPRFGGFCAYGIAAESEEGAHESAATAADTVGYPWRRDALGPPANFQVWRILNGKLYFARSDTAMDRFVADMESNMAAGEKRWASWFGGKKGDSTSLSGPFNVECAVSSSGPIERTCTFEPQRTYPQLVGPHTLELPETCVAALDAGCGRVFGRDDPYDDRHNLCATCLQERFNDLRDVCPSTDDALQVYVHRLWCT